MFFEKSDYVTNTYILEAEIVPIEFKINECVILVQTIYEQSAYIFV